MTDKVGRLGKEAPLSSTNAGKLAFVVEPSDAHVTGWFISSSKIGFFICVQGPVFLARASRRANTICQPRKYYYLPPVNGFRICSSSLFLLSCPCPVDVGCSPPSSSHSSTPFPHNILGAKIPGFAQFRVLLIDY